MWNKLDLYRGEPLSPNPFKGVHWFFLGVILVWFALRVFS